MKTLALWLSLGCSSVFAAPIEDVKLSVHDGVPSLGVVYSVKETMLYISGGLDAAKVLKGKPLYALYVAYKNEKTSITGPWQLIRSHPAGAMYPGDIGFNLVPNLPKDFYNDLNEVTLLFSVNPKEGQHTNLSAFSIKKICALYPKAFKDLDSDHQGCPR